MVHANKQAMYGDEGDLLLDFFASLSKKKMGWQRNGARGVRSSAEEILSDGRLP